MENRFPTLLSPIRVGNHILKNRMISGPSSPHFVQGGENYPTHAFIATIANRAKNGAAIVTCTGINDRPKGRSAKVGGNRNMEGRFTEFDLWDTQSQQYLSQMSEAIHFYGSLAHMEIFPPDIGNYDMSSGIPSLMVAGDGNESYCGVEIPEPEMFRIVDNMAKQCQTLHMCGYDGVFIHMSYKATILGRSLSRITNKRTDKYGGSLPNRCRLPFMVCDEIKRRCGKDFIIEASISGYDPLPDGWTLEETTEFARLAGGHIDIIQMRAPEIDPAHPTGYNPERRPFLFMAEAGKKAGGKVLISTIGGYLDPVASEEVLASGKADLIAMSRAFISNPDYGKLVEAGREADIVPCIRCNKCHRSSYADPWTSVCSVNPKWGLESRLTYMVDAPEKIKSVAVVGGGPAGMKAALVAAQRGHTVTLFEKSGRLGGIVNILDRVSFKWPLVDFKNYLVRKVEQSPGIRVRLNTEATYDILKMGGFDDVIIAVGAEPVIPPIEGVKGKNVVTQIDAIQNPSLLKGDVVVIGGGEIGVEAAMYFCDLGHKTKVIEMQEALARDSTPIHFYSMFKAAWESRENFSSECNATVTKITGEGVCYKDGEGEERFEKADTVVISTGMRALTEKAFALTGPDFLSYAIGDCVKAGNIQKSQRSAFGVASNI